MCELSQQKAKKVAGERRSEDGTDKMQSPTLPANRQRSTLVSKRGVCQMGTCPKIGRIRDRMESGRKWLCPSRQVMEGGRKVKQYRRESRKRGGKRENRRDERKEEVEQEQGRCRRAVEHIITSSSACLSANL